MLPTTSSGRDRTFDWLFGPFGDPSERGFEGVDLHEVDDAFVLAVDMPGFEREEMSVAWDDGRLNVAAEHADEAHGRQKTDHRTFRFPGEIDEEGIEATYHNGVLEVALPVADADTPSGRVIDIK